MMFCLSTVHSNYVQVLGTFVAFEAQFYLLPASVARGREAAGSSKLSVAVEAAAG